MDNGHTFEMIHMPNKMHNVRSFYGYTLVNNGLQNLKTNKGPLSIGMKQKIIEKHYIIGYLISNSNTQK